MDTNRLNHPFFVFIGPSGSGKTKVAEAVFPKEAKVISHTTRSRRYDEQVGVDYYFDSKEQFTSLIQKNALAEFDCYNGYYYGVAIRDLLEKTTNQAAYDVLTYQGYERIASQFEKSVIAIFLNVSRENVKKRLEARGESSNSIQERLALYTKDMQTQKKLIHNKQAIIIDANQPFKEVVAAVKSRVNQQIDKWDVEGMK